MGPYVRAHNLNIGPNRKPMASSVKAVEDVDP